MTQTGHTASVLYSTTLRHQLWLSRQLFREGTWPPATETYYTHTLPLTTSVGKLGPSRKRRQRCSIIFSPKLDPEMATGLSGLNFCRTIT